MSDEIGADHVPDPEDYSLPDVSDTITQTTNSSKFIMAEYMVILAAARFMEGHKSASFQSNNRTIFRVLLND